MPRNTKPPPKGPSPGGKKVTTDVQEFTARAIVLDREILEGFSAGSNGSRLEERSEQEIRCNDSLNTALETKNDGKNDGHHSDAPVSNKAFIGAIAGRELTDTGVGAGPCLKSFEATSHFVLNSNIDTVPGKREAACINDSSGKIEAPKEGSPGSKQTDHAKDVSAQTEVPVGESSGTTQTAYAKP